MSTENEETQTGEIANEGIVNRASVLGGRPSVSEA